MSFKYNIISLNVRGLRNNFKRKALFRHFQTHYKEAIVFLQETHSVVKDESVWENEWGGKIIYNHYETNSRGICILFPRDLDYKVNNVMRGCEGRCLCVDISFDDNQFIFVNVYAPTKDNDQQQCVFLENTRTIINNFIGANLILCGDFNITLNPVIDKMGGRDYETSIYRNKVVEMMADMELCDIWRVQHKGVKQYTWISPNGKIKSRIDFALVSQFLAPHVKTTRIDTSIKSDHRSVFLTLQGKTFKDRGPGFWKFNCALLGENEFINGMNTLLKDAKLKYENYGDKGLKWDAIKCEIRGFTIKYSKAKARRTRNRESLLLKELTYLENNTSDNEDTVNEEKVILKAEREELVNTKTQGAMIRSKANWAENGEKSQNIFWD
jgi:exonuclease III